MSFAVTKSFQEKLSKEFGIEKDYLEKIYKFFIDIKEHPKSGFKHQYLSHLARTMEEILIERTKNPFFRIKYQKLPEDDREINVGVAKYAPKRIFIIYYHPKMEVKQLRVCLAHELGHLFIAEILEKAKDYDTEPLSTIFGIYKLMDKNEFYNEKCKDYCHKSPEDIIADFKLMKNRKNNIMNLS